MNSEISMRVLVHAPNIHMGGGLVLLKELIATNDLRLEWFQIDQRGKNHIILPERVMVHYVKRSIFSRVFAEWLLWVNSTSNDVILCFNSLPPIFPVSARVVVFFQNRLLIDKVSLTEYPLFVRLRILMERLWSYCFQFRCSRYIVQTPSMAELLGKWLYHKVPISIVSFAPMFMPGINSNTANKSEKFQFVYVASGESHKNHRNLVDAWCLLAAKGYKPSLALTLDQNIYKDLCDYIYQRVSMHALSISNLGELSALEVITLYKESCAMIYPSKCESFGLPLIEAKNCGLSILAPELDYVRDVVVPVETFDPNSCTSIARAVMRFLRIIDPRVNIVSAETFLDEVFQ